MAHVTGSCSTLPGYTRKSPHGMQCDDCEQPAVNRIQGETDSMGAEYADLCQACSDKLDAEIRATQDEPQACEWCNTEQTTCRPFRDFEEGVAGPVYTVCRSCRDKNRAYANSYYD